MEKNKIEPFKPGEKWKIIFLDVDGVICLGKDGYSGFNTEALENLRKIIEKTNARIVISSSWRCGDLEKTKEQFPQWLREFIIDETIRYYNYVKSPLRVFRGNEIETWIHDHLDYPWKAWEELDELYQTLKPDGSFKKMNSNRVGQDYTYVILDDDNDMLYFQKDWFVNTSTMEGLDKQKTEECIQILNRI